MRKALILFMSLALAISLCSCVLEPTVSEVETLAQFLESLSFGDKEIKLANDIDISVGGYTTEHPLILDLSGVTIDLNGHAICGIQAAGVSGNGDHSYQVVNCSLMLYGNNFTIKNGALKPSASSKHPIVLTINQNTSFSTDVNSSANSDTQEYKDFMVYRNARTYGRNVKYKGIRLENVTSDNGGIMIYDSEVTLKNCNITQQSRSFTNSIANVAAMFSVVTIDGGSYNNYQSLGAGKFVRWLKLYWSTGYVSNGVRHNINATHYKYVEDSMFYLDKSTTGTEVPEYSK
ncbi:MAG: hypothetical protein MJ057_00410 [Sphaerochaetaceae bacterium]|nr:hypothetical protein [Sphaerochaetaceae bacterium]